MKLPPLTIHPRLMKRLNSYSFYTFHTAVILYSLLLIMLAIPVWGQGSRYIPQSNSVTDYQIQNLDRRISTIEALNLDKRLAVIEALLSDVKGGTLWSQLSMGGVGLILLKEAVNAVKKRKEE